MDTTSDTRPAESVTNSLTVLLPTVVKTFVVKALGCIFSQRHQHLVACPAGAFLLLNQTAVKQRHEAGQHVKVVVRAHGLRGL